MKLDRIIAVRNNKTIYRDGELCMKVFGEGYSKADILNEALNQARVEETGLLIPKVHEVTMLEGRWTVVSDYIKGKTLAQLMEESPERKEEYLGRLVDVQLEILSRSCPLLTMLRDKMRRKIDKAELPATVRYDLMMRLESMPKHSKLCHGDLNPSNVIITENDEAYVLDWAHATQGNAAADAARTYLLFWLSGDISGARRYLELYCEKSGEEKQYVQQWMPIVAASQSVKGRAAEREFLLSWADVVEYD